MTADELRAIKERRQLKVAELAAKLGVKQRALYYYLDGTNPIPESVALLALAMDRKGKRK